ncbi:hypothetical protein VNI00_001907 [Paramarasmius palmivorus]|uniref:AB hydrolase-1 domain-containing protein n=1 Tax=Paramarasmius palmivorus TaxID=297713 RepID=A0AAW0E4V2_9AGAR
MIGTTLHEYLFILLSILALRLIAPASILYIIYSAATLFNYTPEILFSPWILAYAILEASFCLGVYWPRRLGLQKGILHDLPTQLTRAEREDLFNRCASVVLTSSDPFASYPMGWFSSAQGRLKRQNVVEWLLWALYSCKPQDALLDEWKEELDEYVRRIEERLGYKLEDGYDSIVKSMRLLFDPVGATYRPLIWYLIVGLVDVLTACRLYFLGFTHYSPDRPFRSIFSVFPFRFFTIFSRNSATPFFPYWYRPHKSPDRDPIVFIHGIGIGLYPYVPFIATLAREDPDVGILLVELLPISNRILLPFFGSRTHVFPIPIRQKMLDALYAVMKSLGEDWERATLVAHSYGTAIAAHDIRTRLRAEAHDGTLPYRDNDEPASPSAEPQSPIFTSYLLIDPIPFLLHLPPVAYNFLYRAPWRNRSSELGSQSRSLWQRLYNSYNANEWQLWYFASRDLEVAYTLSRRFFWDDVVLWKEDLGLALDTQATTSSSEIPVAVVLSGGDQIVPAAAVKSYLTGGEVVQSETSTLLTEGTEDILVDFSEGTDSTASAPHSTSTSWALKRLGVFEHYHNLRSRSSDTNGKAATPGFRLQEVLYYPDLDHATVFDTNERREGLVEVLRRFNARSASNDLE